MFMPIESLEGRCSATNQIYNSDDVIRTIRATPFVTFEFCIISMENLDVERQCPVLYLGQGHREAIDLHNGFPLPNR